MQRVKVTHRSFLSNQKEKTNQLQLDTNANLRLYKGIMMLMLLLKKTKDIGTERAKMSQKSFLPSPPKLYS